MSLADQLRQLADAELVELFADLTAEEIAALGLEWREVWARPDERDPARPHLGRGQLPPPGRWTWWASIGGRGSGKTRSCAEWVSEQALLQGAGFVVHLVGQTPEDAAASMIEGHSGLRAVSPPWAGFTFRSSKEGGILTWANGARGRLFGATVPRKARGPACCAMWLDDPAAFPPTGLETFAQLLHGFRERMPDGSEPRGVISSTPIDSDLLDEILAGEDGSRGDAIVYSASWTDDNRANLAETLFTGHLARIAGTDDEQRERFGRRPPRSDASPFRAIDFDALRLAATPQLIELAVAIDPALSSGTNACEVGIVGGGRDARSTIHVRHDRSAVLDAGLAGWPSVAWDLAEELQAVYPGVPWHFVLEVNRGRKEPEALLRGEEVRRQLRRTRGQIGTSSCEIRPVTSDKDKCKRAESPARLAAQNQVRFGERLARLEGQLRALTPAGTDSDRADAAVHLVNDLAGLGEAAEPDMAEATRRNFAGLREAQRRMPEPAFRGNRV